MTAARALRRADRREGQAGVRGLARGACLAPALALLAAGCASIEQPGGATSVGAQVWRFDNLQRIGGVVARTEGDPRIVATEKGPAVEFDGVNDAMFIATHPLAGAQQFTAEAIFRPDGGAFEQRWLHLAEATEDAPAGADPPVPPSGPRMLFEIRVVGDRWYLDAFTKGPGYDKALMAPEKTFPVGQWYHVAQVYDGRTYRSYVNGELQAEAEIAFQPQGPGHSSVGTRINRRDYFNGAVLSARFTPSALTPDQFMRSAITN